MNHTENFNRIMNYSNKAHKIKKEQKKITPSIIGGGDTDLKISIGKCSIAGDTVFLPSENLSNYADVRKALMNAGAIYKRNSFIFPNDAKPYIDRLMDGGSLNIKKEFQFFATPAKLAQIMVKIADVNNYQTILEPSAGQGAIIKAVKDVCDTNVDYCELMDINAKILQKMSGCTLISEDFLKLGRFGYYDRIIANPPFNKNQDIEHIKLMFKHLKTGGRIVTIASNSWRTGSQKKQVDFRNWLDEIGAVIEDIESGTFKESGTNIATCMIIIDK